MPGKGGKLTAQERVAVERFAATGDRNYAMEKAGYAHVAANTARVFNRPAVQESIKRQQIARLNDELLPLAIGVLHDILTSAKATERGKLAATAQVLKHTIGANIEAGEGKEPHEMSADELQQRIQALRHEQADRAKPIVDVEPNASGVFG